MFYFGSVKALMTLPNAERDLLIILASSKVCPVALVFNVFSEPAKSIQYNFPNFDASVFVLFLIDSTNK